MSDPDSASKQEEVPVVSPDGELDDKILEEVAGGFVPCPEPPRIARITPADLQVKITTGQ